MKLNRIIKTIFLLEFVKGLSFFLNGYNLNQKEIVDLNVLLFEKFIEFEKNLINFELLTFIYMDIGRVALNSFNFRDAVKYAQAGIEFNHVMDDEDSANACSLLLLDTACLMKSFKGASKVLDKYPNIDTKEFRAKIEQLPSESPPDFMKLFISKRRPRSLRICLDKDKRHYERVIRSTMKAARISRSVAIEYKKMADETPDDFY